MSMCVCGTHGSFFQLSSIHWLAAFKFHRQPHELFSFSWRRWAGRPWHDCMLEIYDSALEQLSPLRAYETLPVCRRSSLQLLVHSFLDCLSVNRIYSFIPRLEHHILEVTRLLSWPKFEEEHLESKAENLLSLRKRIDLQLFNLQNFRIWSVVDVSSDLRTILHGNDTHRYGA